MEFAEVVGQFPGHKRTGEVAPPPLLWFEASLRVCSSGVHGQAGLFARPPSVEATLGQPLPRGSDHRAESALSQLTASFPLPPPTPRQAPSLLI